MVLRSNPLSSAHKYVNDFNALPPFGLFNISSHLIYSSTEYHKQGLAVYKAFNDYRLFEEGYVESLLTKPLPSVGVHLFVGKSICHLFMTYGIFWKLKVRIVR